MAVDLQKGRDKIGVYDKEAQKNQFSVEREKQQQQSNSTKQIFQVAHQEAKDYPAFQSDTAKEDQDKPISENGDEKINPVKMAAATGAGAALSAAASASGCLPSTTIAAAHAAPLMSGFAAPLFGFF